MSTTTTAEVAIDDADAIGMLRGQIDALDDAITRLVAERGRLSRRIQVARLNAGGTRVELGRERVILERYRSALGSDGVQLANSVLRVCRGAHGAAANGEPSSHPMA